MSRLIPFVAMAAFATLAVATISILIIRAPGESRTKAIEAIQARIRRAEVGAGAESEAASVAGRS